MKRRTYKTIDGDEFIALRPENEVELGAILVELDEDPEAIDVEHGGHQADEEELEQ